jgi:hypothetical protein
VSLAKRQLEEEYERGYRALSGFVCDRCFSDETVIAFVQDHAQEHRCDFCGRSEERPIAAPADEVADLIVGAVESEWTDPINELGWDSREGGYQGDTYDFDDVLEQIGNPILTWEFQQALQEAVLTVSWCKRDYVALPLDEGLAYDWDEFVHSIKYRTRFFLPLQKTDPNLVEPGQSASSLELLESIGRLSEQAGLIRRLDGGERFWRVRSHVAGKSYCLAGDLGTPRAQHSLTSSRMSPAGIPAFYGASSLDTALAEARVGIDPDRPEWSAGEFGTSQPCTVLDLSDIPEIPSIFDPDRRHLRHALIFLAHFAEQVAEPLSDDKREHVDYVPTQVVSEFFRVSFSPSDIGPVNGIVYRSARHPGGKCVALFVPHERCLDRAPSDDELALVLSDVRHG